MHAHGPTVRWPTGIELTFLRPQFPDNVAFSIDGGRNQELDFEYDVELSPRLWFGYQRCDGLGWRIAWWEFSHSPDSIFTQPQANETISLPTIDGLELSSNTSADRMLAASILNAYTWDWEITKHTAHQGGTMDFSLGVRYALADQSYFAEIRNSSGVLLSGLKFDHWIRGVGPTVSLTGSQFINCETNLFVRGRGSVLLGDHKSDLIAATPTLVRRHESNGETLSIVELQAGFGWELDRRVRNPFQPFALLAFEGQFWSGPGNASTADGDAWLLGVTLGGGCRW
jgi:hypothetical protein